MKTILFFLITLLILVLAGCSKQTIVKYQCVDGSFVDSANLCSSKSCPETNCPKLDCASCPVKTETKNLIKYQCYDGNVRDNEGDCTKTEIQNMQVDCPQLKEIDVMEWRSILGSIYIRLNNSYNGVNLYGYTVIWSLYVQCEKGKDKGDNLNWWYCGKYYDPLLDSIHLKKMIADKSGEIVEIINKEAYNMYNENFEFIKTVCE